MFGKGDGAWINWVGRWTAEEGRHAIVLRDYLTVTRNIDPVLLERGRMTQLQQGYDHDVAVDPARPRLRRLPGAGDAHRPSQHRALLGRPGRGQDHGPHRRRREPAHGLLPRHPGRRHARSSRRRRSGPSSTRSWPSRCPAPASPASCARRPRSPRPASTTCASIATRSCCRSSGTGASSSSRASTPPPRTPAAAWPSTSTQLDAAARRFEEKVAPLRRPAARAEPLDRPAEQAEHALDEPRRSARPSAR